VSPAAKPPRLGRLLLRLCRLGDRRSDVEADLHELFDKRVLATGVSQARRRFIADVWSLLLPSRRSLTSGLRSDVRDALRALRRTPVQTASLYLCLLLGTTLTVVMFSFVNTVLFGELPGIEDRSTLFRLTTVRVNQVGEPTSARGRLSLHHVQALPTDVPGTTGRAFQIESVFGSASVNGAPTIVKGQFVNGAYFSVLGTAPARGRLLQPADDNFGAPPVAVIGHDFWRRHFGGRDDVLGKNVGAGPHTFTIVGVLPEGFGGIADVQIDELGNGATDAGDVWLPVSHATWGRDALGIGAWGATGSKVVLRRAPDASEDEIRRGLLPATAALDAEAKARAAQDPNRKGLAVFAGFDIEPFMLTEEGTSATQLAGGISLLMTVPVLVLLIACTNVAGVQLSRALRRTHELATRVALGATRLQLARLIALETAVVALAAGVSAWFITAQVLRLTTGLLPLEIRADWRVFALAMGIPFGVTILSGLAPSWRATGFRVLDGLQQGPGAGMSARVSRTRRVVLAVQIALCVALLGTAMHLSRAIANLPDTLAPRQTDVLVTTLRMGDIGMTDEEQVVAWQTLAERLPALPGITHVGFGEDLFSQGNWGDREDGRLRRVSAQWFDAIGANVIAGRLPTDADPDALVINETLAGRFGGVEASLGRVVKSRNATHTVVGIVADGYERVAWNRRVAMGYQVVANSGAQPGGTIFLKGPGAAEARKPLLDMLAAVHPQLAPWDIGTIAELVDERFVMARLSIRVLAAMSLAALVLAAVGLFGAMAQSASSRVREFGVRLALGARPADIGRLIIRETTLVCGFGLLVGLAAATLVAFGVKDGLETIAPFDPYPALVVGAAVVVIALLAGLTPARRVMAIDPVATLRGE
jgi:predicted permease